jgi:exosortase K
LLKLAYSRAGADELAWVLTPSAGIAQLAGVTLVPEPGAGFISRSAHMVVGPACAGVNFLLASWLALYACLQSRAARLRGMLALSVLCFGAAYLATVAVNGLRITLAAQLFSLDIYGALWTKARVHRLLGVVLYAAGLCALCLAAERLRTRAAQPLRAARALAIALTVYLGVTLGIPLAHRVFLRNPAHFGEHALLTLLGAAAVASLFLLAHRLARRFNRATANVCSHSDSA